MLYGFNEILVPVQGFQVLFVLEILNPFYVFQVFSLIVWFNEGYFYYAIAVIFMSAFGIFTSIRQTRSVSNVQYKPCYARASLYTCVTSISKARKAHYISAWRCVHSNNTHYGVLRHTAVENAFGKKLLRLHCRIK